MISFHSNISGRTWRIFPPKRWPVRLKGQHRALGRLLYSSHSHWIQQKVRSYPLPPWLGTRLCSRMAFNSLHSASLLGGMPRSGGICETDTRATPVLVPAAHHQRTRHVVGLEWHPSVKAWASTSSDGRSFATIASCIVLAGTATGGCTGKYIIYHIWYHIWYYISGWCPIWYHTEYHVWLFIYTKFEHHVWYHTWYHALYDIIHDIMHCMISYTMHDIMYNIIQILTIS